jgi:hypothetical protein
VTLQAVRTDIPTDEIADLIATLSGVARSRVYWDGEKEHAAIGPVSGKAGKIVLNVTARAINGREEVRQSYEVANATQPAGLVESWGAHRTLTISMRADNFLGHGEAFDLLEKVRVRLVRYSSREALRDVGLAFVEASSVQTISYNVDNRAVSSARMDMRVAQVLVDRDVDASGNAVANSWIETADIAGNVQE